MEYQEIRGRKHHVFENKKEYEQHFKADGEEIPIIEKDWRTAPEGAWVNSDDRRIVQILRRGELVHHNDRSKYRWAKGWIRTIVGTFVCHEASIMDTDFSQHPSRYTFGGKPAKTTRQRDYLTNKELAFSQNIAAGMGLIGSIRDAFDFHGDSKTARRKAMLLLKEDKVLKQVNKSIIEIAQGHGIDHEFILTELKEFYIANKTDEKGVNAAIRALIELGKAIGTIGGQTQIQQSGIIGVFDGFGADELTKLDPKDEVKPNE